MVPAPYYSQISEVLNDPAADLGIPAKHNVVGFIFFDQNFEKPAISDLLSNLNLLHQESGELIHFFLPGISLYRCNDGESDVPIGKIEGIPAFHNAKSFISFKNEFESRIANWKYRWGLEIVLMDIIAASARRELDFDSAISFRIEEFIRLEIVGNTTEFLTMIIDFRKRNAPKTAKQIKQALREKFGMNWFKELVLSIFPKALSHLARLEAVLEGGSATREAK